MDCYQKGCWYPRAEQFQSEPYICYAGYINFLIAYFHIFDTFKFVPIINLLLNSLQLFALYHISKKICNPAIAHYFVILYCILFSNISIVVPTTSDLFFTTFLFCSIALIREKHLFLLLSGLLIAYANYIRPFTILFLLPIFFYVLYHKFNWKYYISYFCGIGIMTLLLILFNYRINGTTNIVATTSGINLIIGANDDINGTYTNKVFQKGKIGYIENPSEYNVFQKDSIYMTRSKGWIKENAQADIIPPAYEMAGASVLSILTDENFFGGNLKDIRAARPQVSLPILRKDFIIDEYQLYHACIVGADAVLLMAAARRKEQCSMLAAKAHELKLEVLLEIHSEQELEYIEDNIDMVGVNNRNLGTFHTDVENSFRLAEKLPKEMLLVSESGISSPQTVRQLRAAGFRGFLIGENFMKTPQPGNALKEFISKL